MRPNTLVIGYYRDKVSVDQLMDSVADKAHKVGPGPRSRALSACEPCLLAVSAGR